MGSCMYSKLLPDNGDLDNQTGNCPGYRVYVCENDGGVELSMVHASQDPCTNPGSQVFMNVDEAKVFVRGVEAAIARAEPKHANHPVRAVDC